MQHVMTHNILEKYIIKSPNFKLVLLKRERESRER
jgi:hypothetical protein